MIQIRNKVESVKWISRLGLNTFDKNGETIFANPSEEDIVRFMDENPIEYYMIRDKKNSGGKRYLHITRDEVLEHYKEYELFSLGIANYNYRDNQILAGDIFISRDNTFMIIASADKTCEHRNFPKPNFIFRSDIFDKRIKNIPGINRIIDYVYKYELFDMVVEFFVFDIPVGANKEYVVIIELRTDY